MAEDIREPRVGDAFGEMPARCWDSGLRPGASFEIIERDDGMMAAGDAVRYFHTEQEMAPLERWACARAHGRVLDIGCGAGRHAVAVRVRGCEVVGLDPSPGAVRVARERGVDAVPGTLEEPPGDLGGFDTFLLLGNNLGLLRNADAAPGLLDGLRPFARPGARIIAASADPEGEDGLHRTYHEWNRQRGRMPGQLRLRVRDRALASPWFDYLMASSADLAAITDGTAWRVGHVEHDGGAYIAVLVLRG
ncbi:methyltransferase family protein [Murinocardiopsis flavida]|uniref:Methyltransferase family protein n=1 Tax=Murinocardiopsis flavida TaxID=645275 RepID=A0A2P8DQC4_9ACTN|nr:class I SAM-dependent methyltransferase [Murinocardiopsis flavida]PSK99425.1 methyltransferase family protein [Murinocardiopsis flavida]